MALVVPGGRVSGGWRAGPEPAGRGSTGFSHPPGPWYDAVVAGGLRMA